jgi:hypothetical protein
MEEAAVRGGGAIPANRARPNLTDLRIGFSLMQLRSASAHFRRTLHHESNHASNASIQPLTVPGLKGDAIASRSLARPLLPLRRR